MDKYFETVHQFQIFCSCEELSFKLSREDEEDDFKEILDIF